MMNKLQCDTADLLIQKKIDGPLSDSEQASLDLHLGSCPECSRAYAAYTRLHALSSTLPERRVPADFSSRVITRILEEKRRSERSLIERLFGFDLEERSLGLLKPIAAAAVMILLTAVMFNVHGGIGTERHNTALIVPQRGSLVRVASGGQPATVSEDMAVSLNDSLSVETGQGSKAAIKLRGGSAIAMGAASSCVLRDGQMVLSRGTMVAEIGDSGTTHMIETPGALLEIVGTRIALRVMPGELTRVGVFSGHIMVHPIQGKSFALKKGQQFMVSPGGRVLAMGDTSGTWFDGVESDLM